MGYKWESFRHGRCSQKNNTPWRGVKYCKKGGINFPIVMIGLTIFRKTFECSIIRPSFSSELIAGLRARYLNFICKVQHMKSKLLLFLLIVTMTAGLMAQESPKDSVERVKQQQRIGEITKQLNDRKEKLTKMEIELLEETKDKEKAINEAQESADKNRQAAVKLSNDAEDRKKAKKAEKYSDEARRDGKKARRASKNLEEIEKDIKLLKKRIAEDEKTLSDLNPEKAE